MTRNTKFYKVSAKIKGIKQDIYYKDLTTIQLSVLGNIKNVIVQREMAANMAVTNVDPELIALNVKLQIGEDIIFRSEQVVRDITIFDLTIKEMRERVNGGDSVLSWLSQITRYFPGTSVVELLNLTYKDLIELITLIEGMTGSQIFGAPKKKGMSLINMKDLPDGGQSLKESIRKLNGNI